MCYYTSEVKRETNLLIMAYLIDLNIEGNNFKMNGTLEEIESAVEKHGGKDLTIFDSRVEEGKKIIQFMAGDHQVTGHAVQV